MTALSLDELVRSIVADPANVDWDGVYTRLCHQGTTSAESYAVVPHLVDIAATLAPFARFDILLLVGEIAGADETALSADLEPPYRDALRRAESLLFEVARHAPKGRAAMRAKVALAKVRGDLALAEELEDELDEDE